MAKYQKYAEYQDSGVEWLGEIPKDWGVLKLKYAVDLISEKSQDINQKYVGMENITSKNGKYGRLRKLFLKEFQIHLKTMMSYLGN